jgi:hypothetical protein
MNHMEPWNPAADQPRLPRVMIAGRQLKAGDCVRLRPRGRADLFDLVLDGKLARVESIEQDFENQIHLAVTLDDDPGRDFGELRMSGHRFFFRVDEVELLDEVTE